MPWRQDARAESGYVNCVGLVLAARADTGLPIPDPESDVVAMLRCMKAAVPVPTNDRQAGDLVVMDTGHRSGRRHWGILDHDRRMVIHAAEGIGVVRSDCRRLPASWRLIGFRRLKEVRAP